MSLEPTVQEIAEVLKLEAPTPDSGGRYSFKLKGGLQFDLFQAKSGETTLFSALEGVNLSEDLLKDVLQWNFTRLREHFETVTWEPDADQLVLYRKLSESELREKTITQYLEDFLNSVEFWNAALKSKEGGKTSAPLPH